VNTEKHVYFFFKRWNRDW